MQIPFFEVFKAGAATDGGGLKRENVNYLPTIHNQTSLKLTHNKETKISHHKAMGYTNGTRQMFEDNRLLALR